MVNTSIIGTCSDRHRNVTDLPRLGGPAGHYGFSYPLGKENWVSGIITDNHII